MTGFMGMKSWSLCSLFTVAASSDCPNRYKEDGSSG